VSRLLIGKVVIVPADTKTRIDPRMKCRYLLATVVRSEYDCCQFPRCIRPFKERWA
jgi:hypothetical protein